MLLVDKAKMATVKLFGHLRPIIGGSHLQIPGENIQAVIAVLCERYPILGEEMLENGALRPFYKIVVDGHDISLAQGLETSVRPDAQIAIFPPIAGG